MKEITTLNLIMTNKATLVHELKVTETLEDSDMITEAEYSAWSESVRPSYSKSVWASDQ